MGELDLAAPRVAGRSQTHGVVVVVVVVVVVFRRRRLVAAAVVAEDVVGAGVRIVAVVGDKA